MRIIKMSLLFSIAFVFVLGVMAPGSAVSLAGHTGAVRVTRTVTAVRITRTPYATAIGSSAEAKQAIESYARDELGTTVAVVKAGAASLPNLALSIQGKSSVDAALKVAARSYGATLTRGGAIVAYGSGSVSGDISAEMSYGSLGAYVLVVDATPPADAAQALAIVKKTFPAVAGMAFEPTTSAAGSYTFYASGSDSTLNPKTLKAEAVGTAALVGTTTVNKKVTAWIVLGRGKFAMSVESRESRVESRQSTVESRESRVDSRLSTFDLRLSTVD